MSGSLGPQLGAEAAGRGFSGRLELRRPLRPVPSPPFADFGGRAHGRLPPWRLLPAAAATATTAAAASSPPPPPPPPLQPQFLPPGFLSALHFLPPPPPPPPPSSFSLSLLSDADNENTGEWAPGASQRPRPRPPRARPAF
uniref:Uncharacterized protein n=1 Tax=Sus scrofa TaxID=9823 RepID=A0A4X1WAU6_PIG